MKKLLWSVLFIIHSAMLQSLAIITEKTFTTKSKFPITVTIYRDTDTGIFAEHCLTTNGYAAYTMIDEPSSESGFRMKHLPDTKETFLRLQARYQRQQENGIKG